ncbi:MAG: Ldh family oxidoreductase [Desulfobacteraceae bacterium]|nr:MAG: Ldh family oxidoreductase [Desulfobacteraceae bacterium]
MADQSFCFSPEALTDFAQGIFRKLGLPPEDAATTAECLVKADLRGLGSHGVSRIPLYAERLRLKLVNAKPHIRIRSVAPAAAHVDGDDGMGMVVGSRAMASALSLAETAGVGLAGVYRSTHFGMAAFYVLQAVEKNFIGFAFTNASPGMAPWGGAKPVLGVNPLSVGVPAGQRYPIVLDMAMSVMARGKMRLMGLRGEPIPENTALDSNGNPTRDGLDVHKGGTVLPFGGPKGSALAIWMEVMAGVLTGAAFAGEMRDLYGDLSGPQRIGHLFMAVRPDLFMPMDEFKKRMDVMIDRFVSSPKAEGVDRILMPGEPEQRKEAELRAAGIPLEAHIVDQLRREADRLDVHFPEPIDQSRI